MSPDLLTHLESCLTEVIAVAVVGAAGAADAAATEAVEEAVTVAVVVLAEAVVTLVVTSAVVGAAIVAAVVGFVEDGETSVVISAAVVAAIVVAVASVEDEVTAGDGEIVEEEDAGLLALQRTSAPIEGKLHLVAFMLLANHLQPSWTPSAFTADHQP